MADSFLLNPVTALNSIPPISSHLLFIRRSAAASGLHQSCRSSAVMVAFNHRVDHSSFLILWWLPNVLYVAKISSPQASEHFKENHTSLFLLHQPSTCLNLLSPKFPQFLSLVSKAHALDSELFPKYHFAIGNPLFSHLIMQTLNYSFRDSIAAIVFSDNPSLLWILPKLFCISFSSCIFF